MAFPLGRYWAANLGSVMSGLVELGVMVARSPSLRIGAIALPDPLIWGPMLATTPRLATSFRALTAACAGSYWPAVAVPLSKMMGSIRYPATPPLALASSLAPPLRPRWVSPPRSALRLDSPWLLWAPLPVPPRVGPDPRPVSRGE